jgi:hypothetical protein
MNYLKLIEKRVKEKTHTYPKSVVTKVKPLKCGDSLTSYYFFNGKVFKYINTIPSWSTKNGKYQSDLKKIAWYYFRFPAYSIQEFITIQKPDYYAVCEIWRNEGKFERGEAKFTKEDQKNLIKSHTESDKLSRLRFFKTEKDFDNFRRAYKF